MRFLQAFSRFSSDSPSQQLCSNAPPKCGSLSWQPRSPSTDVPQWTSLGSCLPAPGTSFPQPEFSLSVTFTLWVNPHTAKGSQSASDQWVQLTDRPPTVGLTASQCGKGKIIHSRDAVKLLSQSLPLLKSFLHLKEPEDISILREALLRRILLALFRKAPLAQP